MRGTAQGQCPQERPAGVRSHQRARGREPGWGWGQCGPCELAGAPLTLSAKSRGREHRNQQQEMTPEAPGWRSSSPHTGHLKVQSWRVDERQRGRVRREEPQLQFRPQPACLRSPPLQVGGRNTFRAGGESVRGWGQMTPVTQGLGPRRLPPPTPLPKLRRRIWTEPSPHLRPGDRRATKGPVSHPGPGSREAGRQGHRDTRDCQGGLSSRRQQAEDLEAACRDCSRALHWAISRP